MTTLAQYEYPILIVAILIGLIVAFWAFRRRPAAPTKSDTLRSTPATARARTRT